MAIRDIQPLQIIRHDKEHVLILLQALEARRVIWEMIEGIRGRGIAEEDTGHVIRVIVCQLWIIAHDIRVGSVGYKDKFPLREGLEHALEEVLSDAEGSADV